MPKRPPSLTESGLSATHREAMRLLASGCTAKYTALVLKVKDATVRKWLREDSEFQSELATLLDGPPARQARRGRPKIGAGTSLIKE